MQAITPLFVCRAKAVLVRNTQPERTTCWPVQPPSGWPARLGFRWFIYWRMRPAYGPRTPLYITNYPTKWMNRHVERGYDRFEPAGHVDKPDLKVAGIASPYLRACVCGRRTKGMASARHPHSHDIQTGRQLCARVASISDGDTQSTDRMACWCNCEWRTLT
jgi:hypothetical protein